MAVQRSTPLCTGLSNRQLADRGDNNDRTEWVSASDTVLAPSAKTRASCRLGTRTHMLNYHVRPQTKPFGVLLPVCTVPGDEVSWTRTLALVGLLALLFVLDQARAFSVHTVVNIWLRKSTRHIKGFIIYDGDTQQWVKKRHTIQSTDFLIDDIDVDSESDLDQDRSSRSSSSNDYPPIVGFDKDGDSDEEVSDVVDEASLEEGNLAAWPFKHTPWITQMMTSRLLP